MVLFPVLDVRVGGRLVEVTGFDVSSELDSAMPTQVAVAGGQVIATTGSVSFVVDEVARNPWGVTPVRPGQTVTVDAGYLGDMHRVFTGVVDSVHGGHDSPVVAVGVIDRVDKLDKRVSLPALLSQWPMRDQGVSGLRRTSLSPLYHTDRALRRAGFYATPPTSGTVVFSATMAGSAYPEHGTVTSAGAASDPDKSVAFRATPWGIGLGNGNVNYTPRNAGSGKLDAPFQFVFCLDLRPAAETSLGWDIRWGTATIGVAVTSAGTVVARIRHVGGDPTNVLSMPYTAHLGSDVFRVTFAPTGAVSIYASNGATAATTVAFPDEALTTSMDMVAVRVPEASHNIAGLWAGYSTYAANQWRRTAVLTPPASEYSEFSVTGVPALPNVQDKTAGDIIKDHARAELAAIWLDEHGVFRFMNRNRLASQPVTGTLTSMDDLLSLSWEIPAKAAHSRVTVIGKEATITRRVRDNLTLYEGGRTNLGSGDDEALFIEAPADEDWFMVSGPIRTGSGNEDFLEMRRGRGSYMGGVVVQDDTDDRHAWQSDLTQTWSRLWNQKWLLKSEALITSNFQTVETRLLNYPGSYGRFAGQSLPIIRGRAKTRWDDVEYVGTKQGPADGPELTHDVGAWVQQPEELQGIADWLANQLAEPQPILRDVQIVPDPSIRKGQIYWLQDDDAYGVRLKVIIMGVSISFDAGPPPQMAMSITCRVLQTQRHKATLGEHDHVWAGRTLAQHDAFWAGKTLAQHDADPLGN